MDLIFKFTTPSPPATPLVGDTNFQEHYAGVNTAMAWSELKPAIRQAIQKYLIPYVGQPMYDDLAAKYNAGTTLTTAQAQALEYLQDAAANYAIYHILPQKTATVASLGIVQQSPEGGAQPVNQWGWQAKRRDALDNGDSALDLLLKYLDKQVKEGVAYFNLWKDSNAYSKKKSDFFRSTEALDDYINMKGSFRTYISLVPFLGQVERRYIKPLLCDELYAAVLATNPTDDNKKLLPLIQTAVAYLGAAEALPHHRVVVDGDGFRVVSFTDGSDDRRNLTNSTHEQAVGALLTKYKESGEMALEALKAFLEANLNTYPTYRDSACREVPKSKDHTLAVSPDRIGTVGLF